MATTTKSINVLQHARVAPHFAADEEAPEQCLRLTFFDMLMLPYHSIQRLLFYQHPCSTTHFHESIIPHLKNSLSQTLSHYLPLAGNFLYPLNSSGFPQLCFLPGDSLTVTFAESRDAFDFNCMTGDQARDADDFHYLVPEFPEPIIDSNSGFKISPVLAIQVTLFPETGISIGVTNHHVVGDASSIVGFIKAWSSTSKLGQFGENQTLPFYDRSVIRDPSNRVNIFWNQIKAFPIESSKFNLPTNKVRRTFVLQQNEIEKLKNLVLTTRESAGSIHVSSFTVTIAYVWACFAKSAAEMVDDNEAEYFGFTVEARRRLDPPVPATYFGNCLTFVVAESTHGTMRGGDGFLIAAHKIGELISEKVNRKEELLRDADNWLVKYGPLMGKRTIGVVGSPKFDLYDTDFGWGKPVQFESVSIDGAGLSVSICKSRQFERGLEIGVSLPKREMDAFEAAFYGGWIRNSV